MLGFIWRRVAVVFMFSNAVFYAGTVLTASADEAVSLAASAQDCFKLTGPEVDLPFIDVIAARSACDAAQNAAGAVEFEIAVLRIDAAQALKEALPDLGQKALNRSKEMCLNGVDSACAASLEAARHIWRLLPDGYTYDADVLYRAMKRACDADDLRSCMIYAADALADHHRLIENKRLCEDKGMGFTCAQLALQYIEGAGTAEDTELGHQYASKACDMGAGFGCDILSFLYYTGNGVPQDMDKAESYVFEACDKGYPRACAEIGRWYLEEGSVEIDDAKALYYHARACEGNIGLSCEFVGDLYTYDDISDLIELDPIQAERYYSLGCMAQNPDACSEAGWMHFSGRGIRENEQRGLFFLHQGCDMQSSFACYTIGRAYKNGWGVEPDRQISHNYMKIACQYGSQSGCTSYGKDLYFGDYTTADPDAAVGILTGACDAKRAEACRILADHFASELRGGPIDADLARQYLTRGCDYEDDFSCFKLGLAYELGQFGVAVDIAKALPYYDRACELGSVQACTNAATHRANQ